ncbi:OmpH family outer membrane protein [Aurantibacillus circumpalustris]|uniref:OmpH family outer membrane protein n=1 Tax=Aurantibacillus circumpalustris TaxID=3036359 RepID=UPI00295A5A87|nr:OmpH family outer membrane protein [Aurantibacillus circumpalustris]
MAKNVIIILSIIFGVSALAMSLKNNSIKTVYIDMARVYEEFHLSVELNAELAKTVKARKHILDSLYKNLSFENQKVRELKATSKETIDNLKKLEQEYLYKKNSIEKENQSQSEKCNEKIWKQINRYVESYGKMMNYSYILGATGQGNIMYASVEGNVTDPLILYINQQYEGNNE